MNEDVAVEVLRKRICNEKPIQHFCNDSCMYGGNQCAISMAISALEMQIPKKPIYSDFDDNGNDEIVPYKAVCPVCGNEFEFGRWNDEENHHCRCGQKIDWEGGEPMKEVTVVMNLQVTKIIKNPLEKDSRKLADHTTNYATNVLLDEGYDDVIVSDMKVFKGGAND